MIDVIIDKSYRNAQFTTPCLTIPDFGQGTCEPSVTEKEIFAAMNLVRTDPWNQTIQDALNAIVASFTGTISTYDYYGTGVTVNRNTEEGSSAVTTAMTYLSTKSAGTALDWSPGLYMAA